MYSHWYLLAFLVVKSVVVVGDVSLSCATMTPQLSSNLTCTCTSTGSKIKWQVNGTEIAECFQSGSFCSPPQPSGFTLLVGSSTYNMTIDSFTYDSCVQYTCLDSDNQMLQDSVAPELQIDFNTVPKETKVPASNHSNGEISVSTECFTDHLRIKKQWYIIRNGADSELYTPGESISINNEVFCNECNGDSAYSLKIGINHEEATGDKVEVQFRLVVFHDDNPSQTIDVTFKNFYYVTGMVRLTSDILSETQNKTAVNNTTPTLQAPKDKNSDIIYNGVIYIIIAVVGVLIICIITICCIRSR